MSADETPSFDRNALVGTVLGEKYEILSLLGEGGMGAVYLANHVLMRKRVAIKLLHPDMVGNAEVVARFEREAMAAAHIDHPNVAGATDFGRTEDGAFYLVLEYLEGASLRAVMAAIPVLPTARALRIARQITLGLSRAHALGFVHRDLKPENVMVVRREDEGEQVKVLDFGIAKLADGGLLGPDGETLSSNQPLTQVGMMYGTPEYMSPEQVRADQVDARADLYALGVMLYEMLSGTRPFERETRLATVMAHLQEPVPPLRERAPEVPVALESLILRLLAKEPGDRPESAKEVCRELDEIAEQAGLTPATSLPPVSRLASAPAVEASGSRDLVAAVDALRVTESAPAQSLATVPDRDREGDGGGLAGKLLGALDGHLAPFRRSLPEGIRTLPSLVLVGVPAALVGGAMLLGALFLFWPVPSTPRDAGGDDSATGAATKSEPKTIVASTASDAELAAAKTAGSAALADLAKKFPDDRRIWRPLLAALTSEKRHAEAMALLTASVGNDPVVAAEPGVRAAVLAAVEAGGEATDAAFVALEGPLGVAGADMLYDLANEKGGKQQSRAWKTLAKPEVRKISPALDALLELRSGATCGAKRAALPKIKEVGDKRSVSQLKALRATNGCGFLSRSDCWPCLRGDTLLADALREAEAR